MSSPVLNYQLLAGKQRDSQHCPKQLYVFNITAYSSYCGYCLDAETSTLRPSRSVGAADSSPATSQAAPEVRVNLINISYNHNFKNGPKALFRFKRSTLPLLIIVATGVAVI